LYLKQRGQAVGLDSKLEKHVPGD